MSAFQGHSLDAFCHWESRARFSVSLGCPPFGGQREVDGHFTFRRPSRSQDFSLGAMSCFVSAFGHGRSLGWALLLGWFCRLGKLAKLKQPQPCASQPRDSQPSSISGFLGSVCLARQVHHGWCISGA
jgi:hypothetical protein